MCLAAAAAALPAMLPGIAMAGLGTVLQMREQAKARERTDDAIMASIQGQQRYQDQSIAALQPAIEQYNPETREAAVDAEREQALQGYTNALQETGALDVSDAPVGGRVSDAYLSKRAQSIAEEGESTRRLAALMAKTTAPGAAQLDERIGLADAAAGIGQAQNFAGGQSGVDKINIDQAGGVNPWVYGAGSLLKGAGTAYSAFKPMGGATNPWTGYGATSKQLSSWLPGNTAAAVPY